MAIDDDFFIDLPEDSELAFLQLEEKLRSELQEKTKQNQNALFYMEYLNRIHAIARHEISQLIGRGMHDCCAEYLTAARHCRVRFLSLERGATRSHGGYRNKSTDCFMARIFCSS